MRLRWLVRNTGWFEDSGNWEQTKDGYESVMTPITEKVLQVWVPYDCDDIQGNNRWEDVPVVVEEVV